MTTVAQILTDKQGRQLHCAGPEETVLAATQLMNEHGIGALLVMDDDENLLGIFTERDVLRRVVAEELSAALVRVGEVMTTKVAYCTSGTSIEEAREIFRQYRIRHLPVLSEEGDVQGLISIGDLNAHHASYQEVTIHYLHEYMNGRT